jgi:hypothetical protein
VAVEYCVYDHWRLPQQVPAMFLIKGLDSDTSHLVKPFTDAALNVGLNTNNLAGGSIIDDFNNDGYFDLITSSYSLKEGMRYCRNNTDGTFTEISDSSGLWLYYWWPEYHANRL